MIHYTLELTDPASWHKTIEKWTAVDNSLSNTRAIAKHYLMPRDPSLAGMSSVYLREHLRIMRRYNLFQVAPGEYALGDNYMAHMRLR